MDICEYNKCTGCGACVDICNHNCIELKENQYGELHPIVDESRCVNCGLCIRTCPNNIKPTYYYPQHCYATWTTNKLKRRICASGGVATVISEYIIKEKKGVVFGTKYSAELVPQVTYTEKLDDLEYFKGSKYVQSIVNLGTYRQVMNFLQGGRYVLFIGTPCQIAGLHAYLRKKYEKLYTIDLICHGVSPTSFLLNEVDHICKDNKIDKKSIIDIRFRGNDKTPIPRWKRLLGYSDSNNFAFTLWKNQDNVKELVFKESKFKNYYLAGFLMGVSMRENCYTCNYACPSRISDITIGDFIGLGTKEPLPVKKDGHVSCVLTNTERGSELYELVLSRFKDTVSIERNYSERLVYKPSLIEPFHRHPLNSRFRHYLAKENDFHLAIRKTLYYTILKMRIVYILSYNWNMLIRKFLGHE